MKKYYINPENLEREVSNLIKEGKIPSEYTKSFNESIGRTRAFLREGQYIKVIVGGEHVVVNNIDSAKVPLNIRIKNGDKIDSINYL